MVFGIENGHRMEIFLDSPWFLTFVKRDTRSRIENPSIEDKRIDHLENIETETGFFSKVMKKVIEFKNIERIV